MPKTAPKPPNSSASVLTTSSHKRRRWKRAKHWFCWIPRKRWAKMVSEVPNMIVLWNFATKSRLEASLAVLRNLLPYIFQGGLQPGSPSRQAAPGSSHYRESRWMFNKIWFKFPEHVSLKTLVLRNPCFGSSYPQVVRVPPVKNHCARLSNDIFEDETRRNPHATKCSQANTMPLSHHLSSEGSKTRRIFFSLQYNLCGFINDYYYVTMSIRSHTEVTVVIANLGVRISAFIMLM